MIRSLAILNLLQLQKNHLGPSGNSEVFEKSYKNILKLCKHFTVSSSLRIILEKCLEAQYIFQSFQNLKQTLGTFQQFRSLSKILEKCSKPWQTFQSFKNLGKLIWDLLTIEESLKNLRKMFRSLADILELPKTQKSHLGPSNNSEV